MHVDMLYIRTGACECMLNHRYARVVYSIKKLGHRIIIRDA